MESKPTSKPKKQSCRPTFLLRWLESLDIGPVVDLGNLNDQFRDGLYLIHILKRLCPGERFVGVQPKPRSPASCIANLELALSYIWRKSVRASKMSSATELYRSTTPEKWLYVINLVFEAFVIRQLKSTFGEVIRWYEQIIAPYGFHLQYFAYNKDMQRAERMQMYLKKHLAQDFTSCIVFFCVLHAFEELAKMEGRAYPLPELSSTSMFLTPRSESQLENNSSAVFEYMGRLNIPLFWTYEEWVHCTDSGFMIFQLYLIRAALQDSLANVHVLKPTPFVWKDLVSESPSTRNVSVRSPKQKPLTPESRYVRISPAIKTPKPEKSPTSTPLINIEVEEATPLVPAPVNAKSPSTLSNNGPASVVSENIESILNLSHPDGFFVTLTSPLEMNANIRLVGVVNKLSGPTLSDSAGLRILDLNTKMEYLIGLLEIKNVSVTRNTVILSAGTEQFAIGVNCVIFRFDTDPNEARSFATDLSSVLSEAYMKYIAENSGI